MFERLANIPASKVEPLAPPSPTTIMPTLPLVLGLWLESDAKTGLGVVGVGVKN